MSEFLDLFFIGEEVSYRIALTLLHSLWQGAAIGALVIACFWVVRSWSASARYLFYSFAFAVLPVCVAITFATIDLPYYGIHLERQVAFAGIESTTSAVESPIELTPLDLDHGPVVAPAPGGSDALSPRGATTRAEATIFSLPIFIRLSPVVAVAYGVGASLFLLRLLLGTWGGHRLRTASKRIDEPSLLQMIAAQSRRVGLKLVPTVAYCERVSVPMVVGVLRPVVLLPVSIVTGLDAEQFAAIISHELAHIRRYDLLMNLIQRLVEALLFFHPVVWYISRKMSVEREVCCDDLVVSSGYDRLDYVGALLRMAELCLPANQPNVASIAATGHNPSQFEVRIQRLMNPSKESRLHPTRSGIFCMAILLAAFALTPAVFRTWAYAQDPTPPREADRPTAELTDISIGSDGATESDSNDVDSEDHEQFDCQILDAVTGKPISGKKLTIHFVYREATVNDELGTPVGNVIWSKSASKYRYFTPEKALQRPDRDQLIVHWGIAHPDYRTLTGMVNLGEILRGEPISAREGIRVIRLLPKKHSIKKALSKQVHFAPSELMFAAVMAKLQQEHGIPISIDRKKLRGLKLDSPVLAAVGSKTISLLEVFEYFVFKAGTTFDVTENGIEIPSSQPKIVVRYDIAGAEPETRVMVQHVGGRGEIGTVEQGLSKWTPLKNGDKFELTDIAGGDYDIARYRTVDVAKAGDGRMFKGLYLDRHQFKLKSGELRRVDFVRHNGGPVKGKVAGLQEAELDRALICVCSPNAKDESSLGDLDVTLYDARACSAAGDFQTEHLAAGKYVLVAIGYSPISKEDLLNTGMPTPRYIGVAPFTVVKTKEQQPIEVKLELREERGPRRRKEEDDKVNEDRTPAAPKPPTEDEARAAFKRGGIYVSIQSSREFGGFGEPVTPFLNLSFSGTKVTDEWMQYLAAFPQATELRFSESTQITDEALKIIGQLKNLKSLRLASSQITGTGLKHLAGCTKLKSLTVKSRKLIDKELAQLESLAQLNLTSLSIGGWQSSDDGLSQVSKLTSLRSLTLNVGQAANGDALVTARTFRALAPLTKLTSLEIMGDDVRQHVAVRDEDLQMLANFPQLTALTLSSRLLTNDSLKHIGRCKELSQFSIWHAPITDDGLQHLAPLTKLESMHLYGTKITGTGFRFLNGTYKDEVDGSGNLTSLTMLSLTGASATDAGLEEIARCSNLSSLRIGPYSWFDKDATGPLPVTDAGLAHIAKLGRLASLDLSRLQVTDVGLGKLQACSQLSELGLAKIAVTDKGLGQLSEFKKLNSLGIRDCRSLTRASIESLHKVK
ncbi:MAG: beta-lactamase regulating signal transducer with metallopeptidase domain, partial [Pirellulaceae bacterium]